MGRINLRTSATVYKPRLSDVIHPSRNLSPLNLDKIQQGKARQDQRRMGGTVRRTGWREGKRFFFSFSFFRISVWSGVGYNPQMLSLGGGLLVASPPSMPLLLPTSGVGAQWGGRLRSLEPRRERAVLLRGGRGRQGKTIPLL